MFSGSEEGNTYEHLGDRLDRVNPYEFKKGMDYELTAIGCSRLQESTKEEREKATQIDMTKLPSGIYNLNITHNNKNINNRIVKQ